MHGHLAHDDVQAARFLNEARMGSGIQHPNVVRIYDFGKLPDGAPYMVMEYLPGEDLTDVIERDGKLDPARTARILRQVAVQDENAGIRFDRESREPHGAPEPRKRVHSHRFYPDELSDEP